jgi:hypothetical protein
MVGLGVVVTVFGMKGLVKSVRDSGYRERSYYWLNQPWQKGKSRKPSSDEELE